MRWTWLLFSLLLGLAVAQDTEEVSSEDVGELPLAEPCNQQACQLPDCLCSSTNIPGGLTPRNTPQFVLATFDDGVNIINIETYRNILYNRRNSNGCPTGTTFFVSHEYTNYQLVNELYNRGFEIALHSISHRTPQAFWANSTYEDMVQEFADQRVQMSHFGNIPYDELRGIRIPFLQLAGNNSFQVMADFGITYDSTWVTVTHTNPGMWPYTLDYASTQDCMGPPCPTSSIPGVWVKPMVSWTDLEGFPCAMVDACIFPPDREDEQAWYEFIVSNFERHYLGNRAPFGFYIHQWYLESFPAVQRAFVRFMDLINSLNDVFMVNAGEVIDWVKDPIPVNVYRERPCRAHIPTFCMPQSCNVIAEHNGFEYWMQICNVCPARYPWVGNPLGQ